jgi:hypothetical protein
MSSKYKRYSFLEFLGILLMIAGIFLGCIISYSSEYYASKGTKNFITFFEREITLVSIKSQYDEVWLPLNRSVGLAKLTNVGMYIYLPGLCFFALARRRRWNKAQTEEIQYKTNDTEQGVPGYRRQGAPQPEP